MAQNDWKLVWSDEFNTDGLLDSKVWNYEEGFKRNHEAQWYQKANAYCKDGDPVIVAREEKKARRNPGFRKNSSQWPRHREDSLYLCLSEDSREGVSLWQGRGKGKDSYGWRSLACHLASGSRHGLAVEWRNRHDGVLSQAGCASYPCQCLLGYRQTLDGKIEQQGYALSPISPIMMGNGLISSRRLAAWIRMSGATVFTWTMNSSTRLRQDEAVNGKLAMASSPFKKPQYLLLNLGLVGDNGGEIDDSALPMKYLVDYVRVYQKQ